MNTSSLAVRLEEFAAQVSAVDAPNQKPPRVVAVPGLENPLRAPRRLSFDTRRIQIRDAGLPHFRVF